MNTFKSQLNQISSGLSRPKNVNPTTIKKLGVLGSGLMGHGITYVSALSGIEIVMTDASQENADKDIKGRRKIVCRVLQVIKISREVFVYVCIAAWS